jgi:FecR-like protein/putative zinc finger protein
MQCEEAINLISARLDGELPPDDASRLEAHLSGCAECRATAEAMSLQDAQLVRAFAPRRDTAAQVAGRVVAEQLGEARRTRWRWWIPVAAAAAGFALAVLVMHGRNGPGAHPGPGPVVATATPVAQLDIATGPVECLRPEDPAWQRLATGGALPAGSRVRTGPGVRCEFAMADGSEVRMNENTELELSHPRSVSVADGQVFSSVARKDTPFQVTVGTATITAVGTRFDVQRRIDRVVLAVLEGSTRLTEGTTPERVVNQGEAVSLSHGTVTPLQASAALDQASRWIMDIVVLKGRDNPELNARVDDLVAQIGEGKMAFLRENELKALGDRCVVPLTRYLQSPRSEGQTWKCQEAARVISDVAQPWCIPYLIELLENPDGQVRASAATALLRLTNETQGRTVEQWQKQPKEAGAEAVKSWRGWWERNKDRYPGASSTEAPRSPATRMKT